jgi:hypothetical protein
VFGHAELPVLELAQALPEGPAPGQVLDGDVESALGQGDAGGADGHPGVGEDGQGDLEALALLTEEVVLGQFHLVEDDVGGELTPLAELLVRSAHVTPGVFLSGMSRNEARSPVRQRAATKSATGALVMKRLRPLTTQPVEVRSATVWSAWGDRSVEASGSVVAKEATASPGERGARYSSRTRWVPCSTVRPARMHCPS